MQLEQAEENMPEFDMDEFDAKFDDEHPPIEIPPEVVEDIDNDFNIVIVEEDAE